jgi:hypothetical protein
MTTPDVTPDILRRRVMGFLLAGIAIPPLLRLAPAEAADLPHLSPSDPTASSLSYVDSAASVDPKKAPTYKAGNACGNCAQFQGASAGDWGGCAIFPGKSVNKNGWCMAYTPKA